MRRSSLSNVSVVALVGLAVTGYACKEDDTPVEEGNGGRLVVGEAGKAGSTAGSSAAGTSAAGSAGASGSTAGKAGAAGSTAGAAGSTAGAAGSTAGAAGSTAGAAGTATAGSGPTITLDTFNVAFAGTAVPHAPERKKPVQDALAALDSDVLCLQEAWLQADKDALVAALATNFPNHYEAKTTHTTAVDDIKDLTGATPTLPTNAACANSMTKFDAAMKCATDKCSTMPMSEQGYVTGLDCPQANCVATAFPLLTGSADDKRCYGCFAPQLASEKLADIRTSCTTVPNTGLAYGGQSSPMLFSKHPLKNQQTYVLPATWFRRVILKATVAHPDGDVDVYCHHINPVYAAGSLLYPYTGAWGAGADANGWVNEHLLHATRAVDFAKANSTGKAIVIGDFNASPDVKDGATVISKPDGEKGFALLDMAFPAAQPATKFCTFCPDNDNIPDSDKGAYTPEWIDHVFLKDFPSGAVVSYTRTLDGKTVAAKDSMGKDIMVPLSDHYGVRVKVLLK